MKTQKIETINDSMLANRAAIREHTTWRGEFYKIHFDKIIIREEFNDRENFDNIPELAEQLVAMNRIIKPIMVDILSDGRAVITDGERRFRAVQYLREQGNHDFDELPAMVNPKETTDIERLMVKITANDSEPFTPLEEAHAYAKLLKADPNMKPADIAKALGKNRMHVHNRLLLAQITEEEKDLLREKKVSPTTLVDLIKNKKTAEERIDLINEAADGGGKLKIREVAEFAKVAEPVAPVIEKDPAQLEVFPLPSGPAPFIAAEVDQDEEEEENPLQPLNAPGPTGAQLLEAKAQNPGVPLVDLDVWTNPDKYQPANQVIEVERPAQSAALTQLQEYRESRASADKSQEDKIADQEEINSRKEQAPAAPKSNSLTDLLTDVILMQSGFQRLIDQDTPEAKQKLKDVSGKIKIYLQKAKAIAENLEY